MFTKENLEIVKWISVDKYDVIVKTAGNKSKYNNKIFKVILRILLCIFIGVCFII